MFRRKKVVGTGIAGGDGRRRETGHSPPHDQLPFRKRYSRRGLVSFLLLAAFSVPLIYVALQAGGFEAQISATRANLMAAERLKAVELEVKGAFGQVLRAERAGSAEGKRVAISHDLMALERELERKYSADAWFGNCNEAGIPGLLAKMHEGKKALKCAGCMDFSKISLDLRGEAVPLASAFLSEGSSGIEISRKALSGMPEAYALEFAASEMCFGASIYHDGLKAAQVILMGEGFG